ncbi:MAG: DUF1643 domain-containing protein [Isosphaeraceae bacterium]
MRSDALLSPCGCYRYALWRRWASGPQVLFVMLNPSTADELTDDPTIRRCIGFARSWGFGSLTVGNLFAYRAIYAGELCASPDPVGSENDRWLTRLQEESSLTIAAWGNHGRLLGRSIAYRRTMSGLHILGLTRLGEPRHPLYVDSDVVPQPWSAPLDQ